MSRQYKIKCARTVSHHLLRPAGGSKAQLWAAISAVSRRRRTPWPCLLASCRRVLPSKKLGRDRVVLWLKNQSQFYLVSGFKIKTSQTQLFFNCRFLHKKLNMKKFFIWRNWVKLKVSRWKTRRAACRESRIAQRGLWSRQVLPPQRLMNARLRLNISVSSLSKAHIINNNIQMKLTKNLDYSC